MLQQKIMLLLHLHVTFQFLLSNKQKKVQPSVIVALQPVISIKWNWAVIYTVGRSRLMQPLFSVHKNVFLL